MKLKVWKYVNWCWVCRECAAVGASRSSQFGFASQQSAFNAAMGHLKRWHACVRL